MQSELALIHTPLPTRQAGIAQRILLYAGELYRIPATYRTVRVVEGTALITQAARDLVAGPGRELQLRRGQDVALVSPLRSSQVILELFAEPAQPARRS
jgi:voltage-gated potassium channel Kch